MDEKNARALIQKKQLEDSLRQEFEATLSERVARYQRVRPHPITANTHFAAASAECAFLFRDGHFYGCIALTQAVAEALVRFLCHRNSWRPSNNFETNVEKLSARKVVSDELEESFLTIWRERDDYHHLNPNVETDHKILERLAREKTCLLAQVESDIFAFRIVDGKLVPKYPKYWDITDDQASVFLRLEP